MNSQKLNDWLQIVGLFGVIGSLVFVGLQLKQTQTIALSETYQARSMAAVEANMAAVNSPEILSGLSKIYKDRFDELTMPEAVALEWLIWANVTMIENNHFQFQSGFLSQEHWERNLDQLKCMLTVPLFRDVVTWPLRDSFEKVISDVMKEIPPDAENCWSYDWDFPMQ